jgi:amylosucrase
MMQSVVLAFGGIPLLYYGDELGTLNDWSFLDDPHKQHDSRWLNRPRLDDERRERRHRAGTVEQRVFDRTRHLIATRRALPAFADHDDRVLLHSPDDHVLVFLRRTRPAGQAVLVVVNLSGEPRILDLPRLPAELDGHRPGVDALSGQRPVVNGKLSLPGFTPAWLVLEPS